MWDDKEIVVRNCRDVGTCIFSECINVCSYVGEECNALPSPLFHDD